VYFSCAFFYERGNDGGGDFGGDSVYFSYSFCNLKYASSSFIDHRHQIFLTPLGLMWGEMGAILGGRESFCNLEFGLHMAVAATADVWIQIHHHHHPPSL